MSAPETLAGAALVALYALSALAAAGHALLHVRDPRSAWAWIALCWLAPLLGPVLYLLLGISRVHRLRVEDEMRDEARRRATGPDAVPALPGVNRQELTELLRIGAAVSGRGLARDNAVEPLHTGEAAYEAMLAAIDSATRTVWLMAYIFDAGVVGRRFAAALAAAQARGVQVRVLLDGFGDLYYWPRGSALLRAAGVPVRRFRVPARRLPLPHVNLRNHRKLVTVDGRVAFLGGMNIGDHHVRAQRRPEVSDLHFRVEGPVLAQLEEVFAADWRYATGERLVRSAPAAPPPAPAGAAACRALTDGPDDALDRLQLVLIAALANAHQRVRIMTPYFIPTPELAGALEAAALRGVEIQVVIPAASNLPWVHWATLHWLETLLRHGVRIFLRPAPFAHTKMLLLDHYYAQVGSANLDPRSLHLNFELVLEVYDPAFVAGLARHFDEVRDASVAIGLRQLHAQPLWLRLRNAVFWLFSPWL